ncbi:acyclic terpene utilization AtuA family protein [Nocardioides islandensis]|uniref:acyclic terpene utilization AtuA family protein n=1 Tax=Nocardioides islandensis TaxID=433663 RepID=UPI002B269D2C|nr:acyclic terpene utilization AtuA family protein [Nocardioides islandensis]
MAEALRVGNCSGFYGDRLSAMREMLEGGSLDVLTGDYLAELTMLILGRDQLKDPSLGYARTFVRQLEDCLGLALERGVRIVSNAGGLNPAGLAARIGEVASGLGLSPSVAYVDGDDVRALGFEGALTANAYLGGWGIAAALAEGADVLVTGRVTDASLVVGPAAAHFGWAPDAYDALAGAVVAGHVLECGCQATGGNFSGFREIPHPTLPMGFPLAEIAADGSSVVTKHDGTGGMVSVDTVTAQLMYEVQSTTYLNPDVTTDLTSIRLAADGPDRVRVSGVRGSAPPERLKVGVNELGGYRNVVELVLTGLDIKEKAVWVRAQLGQRVRPQSIATALGPLPREDADREEDASTLLRITVQDESADVVGRAFSSAAVELALASYPGFTMTAPPGSGTPFGVYRAEYVDRSAVRHTVHHADGRVSLVEEGALAPVTRPGERSEVTSPGLATVASAPSSTSGKRVPLGTFVHARSGDKGGDANLGLWVAHDGSTSYDARVAWLLATVTPDFLRELLPETRELDVEVHALPNLGGVNVVVHGLLGRGVAASTRFDPQAKGLGEWARSRHVEIPEVLL